MRILRAVCRSAAPGSHPSRFNSITQGGGFVVIEPELRPEWPWATSLARIVHGAASSGVDWRPGDLPNRLEEPIAAPVGEIGIAVA
jgi:hypothetical protein